MNHELIKNNVRVSLHDETHEGWNGDYNPDDPNDCLLLRFDVDFLYDGDWEPVENGSMCTRLPANLEPAKVQKALQMIMDEVGDCVRGGLSIKKKCEWLSWIEV